MDNETPLVSVFMITYNHEKYIAKAIESVLMQKTDFGYEIVIGEDFSTDRTREIVSEYSKRFAALIKPIFQKRNVGAKKNSDSVRAACTGKYVALLEGDDYWTDPFKLQKQVDFLEAHPDFSICFHRAKKVDTEGRELGTFWPKESWNKPVTCFADLVETNYISTQTVVYRNGLIDMKLLGILERGLCFGDWVTHLLNATRGKIAFLDTTMAAYRVTGSGASAVTPRLKLALDILTLYDRLNTYLFTKLPEKRFNQFKKRRLLELASAYADSGDRNLAIVTWVKARKIQDGIFSNIRTKISAILKIYFPFFIEIQKIRRRL